MELLQIILDALKTLKVRSIVRRGDNPMIYRVEIGSRAYELIITPRAWRNESELGVDWAIVVSNDGVTERYDTTKDKAAIEFRSFVQKFLTPSDDSPFNCCLLNRLVEGPKRAVKVYSMGLTSIYEVERLDMRYTVTFWRYTVNQSRLELRVQIVTAERGMVKAYQGDSTREPLIGQLWAVLA